MHPKAKLETHPLLVETEATLMVFTFGNKNRNLYLTNCVHDSWPIKNVLTDQYQLSANYECISAFCTSLLVGLSACL